MSVLLPPQSGSRQIHHKSKWVGVSGVRFSPLPDVSSLQRSPSCRQEVLTALENPTVFQAVLDETNRYPALSVQAIRKSLKKERLTVPEVFGNPRLLANFYDNLAQNTAQAAAKRKNTAEKNQLMMASAMLQDTAAIVRKNHDLSAFGTDKPAALHSARLPKFGGVTALFQSIARLIPQKHYNDRTKTERKIANNTIIHLGSAGAGLTAGALTKTMVADELFLTAITVTTVMAVSRQVYGLEGLNEATLGVIVGKILGARSASMLLKLVPGIGELANAGTAVALHEATAWLFVHMYEKQIAQGRPPGMPTSLNAMAKILGVASLVGLGPAEHAGEQATLNQLENDDRVYRGDAGFASQDHFHGLDNAHTIVVDGHFHSAPTQDWLFNRLAKSGAGIETIRRIVGQIMKIEPNRVKSTFNQALKEINSYGTPSPASVKKLSKAIGLEESETAFLVKVLKQLQKETGKQPASSQASFRLAKDHQYIRTLDGKRDWHENHSNYQLQRHFYQLAEGHHSMFPLSPPYAASDYVAVFPKKPKDAIERLAWGYGFCELRHFKNVDPDADIDGAGLLHTAVLFNEEAVVDDLIRRNANVNRYSHNGHTPLTISAIAGHLNTTRALISAGADANKKDRTGHTPLYYAQIYNHPDVASYLSRY